MRKRRPTFYMMKYIGCKSHLVITESAKLCGNFRCLPSDILDTILENKSIRLTHLWLIKIHSTECSSFYRIISTTAYRVPTATASRDAVQASSASSAAFAVSATSAISANSAVPATPTESTDPDYKSKPSTS